MSDLREELRITTSQKYVSVDAINKCFLSVFLGMSVNLFLCKKHLEFVRANAILVGIISNNCLVKCYTVNVGMGFLCQKP